MRRLLPLLALLATLLQVGVAQAVESFPVTSTADAGTGSLRQAIEAADKSPGADSIPIGVTGTIALDTALPPIAGSLTISGPGAADLTIERKAGAAPFRVFTFPDPLLSVLRDVTVSGGLDPLGAGILSEGDLTLIGVVVAGNEARAEGGTQAVAQGGGIYSSGRLTLRESVVSGNRAVAEKGAVGTEAHGGGILSLDAVTVDRSTISGNSALADEGNNQGGASGGGIQADEVEITSSTITGNSVAGETFATASNLVSPTGTARNTIVSDPEGEGESCFGAISSGGFNLDEDGSCLFDAGSDLNGVPAGLDPVLRDNGGPTPTHALLPGSIAIDQGNSFGATTDQRGLPRPSDFPTIGNKEGGDGSDIGAFELQAPPAGPPSPPPILVGAEPGDTTPPRTRIVSGPARSGFERLAKFRFSSSEAQSSFRCKLDSKRWRKCRSPYELTVKPGKHLFKVRAIDRFGNADPTPAQFGWRVKPLS